MSPSTAHRHAPAGPAVGSLSLPARLPRPRSRQPFAQTWWGRAWIHSVEDGAAGVPERLARGRTYARGGYVSEARVQPGRVAAYVRGSRPRPYRAYIRLRELTDGEWEVFLDAVAEQPAHVAALADRELPQGAVQATEAAGVSLLPAGGELDPYCSCPDDGVPCKHAAALCYQVGSFVDDDPFVLLLMRGRGERELMDELARRTAAHAAGPADRHGPALPTVLARDALATRVRPALPDPLPPPAAPGEPPALPGTTDRDPPRDGRRSAAREVSSTDPEALAFLVTDAAVRAHSFLTGSGSAPLRELSDWQDAVRTAATHPGLTGRGAFSRRFARLAGHGGGTASDLARAAAAWRQGGEAGLAVLETAWDPPAGDFDRARSALAEAGWPRASIERNRLTRGRFQLRYGRDGRWYPYRADAGSDFWPEGPSDGDPVLALRGMRGR